MVDIRVTGGEISEDEKKYYIDLAAENHPGKHLRAMDIELDGDYANVKYCFSDEPFERIRRITGYLVGTLDRFNNAKRAEEHARVKHSTGEFER